VQARRIGVDQRVVRLRFALTRPPDQPFEIAVGHSVLPMTKRRPAVFIARKSVPYTKNRVPLDPTGCKSRRPP